MATQVPDISVMLCERCGYVLEGMEPDGACPECGLGIEESDEYRRRGSPWQRQPSLRGMWETAVLLHRSPGRLFGALRAERESDADLLWLSVLLGVAALAPIGFLVLVLVKVVPALFAAGLTVVWAVSAFLVTMALCWIEVQGVVYFSRKRGWRVPRELARTIVAHAAPAWVWAWAGCGLGALGAGVIQNLAGTLVGGTILELIVPTAGPVAGFVLGMLVFETLVYMGVRRCKHANAYRTQTYGK